MPKILYCNSIYQKKICDLNPLIPIAFRKKKILVIPARQQQVKRIKKQYSNLTCIGWWDLQKTGMLDFSFRSTSFVKDFDVIVIIDKDRVDKIHFSKLIEEIEKLSTLKDYLVN